MAKGGRRGTTGAQGGGRYAVRVSRGGQVALPAALLRQARIGAGDELEARADGAGRIVLVQAHDPLDDFLGSVPGLAGTAEQDDGDGSP